MTEVYHDNDEAKRFWDELWPQVCKEEEKPIFMLYDPITKRFFPAFLKQYNDPVWRKASATRIARQVNAEGIESFKYIDWEGWSVYVRGLRKRGLAYKGIPRSETLWAVLSLDGNRPLPEAFDKKVDLFIQWIDEKPTDILMRPSKNFGGDEWSGSRPPGRGCIAVFRSAGTISRTLTEDKIKHSVIGEDVVLDKKIAPEEAEKYVRGRF